MVSSACIGKCKVLVLPKSVTLIFVFDGIIQTIFVAFSMKTSAACTGMLSSENDYFKFLKPAQNMKSTYITSTIVAVPNQPVVDQKHERKRSHRAVSYRNLDTANFSVTLSIYAFLESS